MQEPNSPHTPPRSPDGNGDKGSPKVPPTVLVGSAKKRRRRQKERQERSQAPSPSSTEISPTKMLRYKQLYKNTVERDQTFTAQEHFNLLMKELLAALRTGRDQRFGESDLSRGNYSTLITILQSISIKLHRLAQEKNLPRNLAKKIQQFINKELSRFITDNKNQSPNTIEQNALQFYLNLRYPQALSHFYRDALAFNCSALNTDLHFSNSLTTNINTLDATIAFGTRLIRTAPEGIPVEIIRALENKIVLLCTYRQELSGIEPQRVAIVNGPHAQNINTFNALLTKYKLDAFHLNPEMNRNEIEAIFDSLRKKISDEHKGYILKRENHKDQSSPELTLPLSEVIQNLFSLFQETEMLYLKISAIQNEFSNNTCRSLRTSINAFRLNSVHTQDTVFETMRNNECAYDYSGLAEAEAAKEKVVVAEENAQRQLLVAHAEATEMALAQDAQAQYEAQIHSDVEAEYALIAHYQQMKQDEDDAEHDFIRLAEEDAEEQAEKAAAPKRQREHDEAGATDYLQQMSLWEEQNKKRKVERIQELYADHLNIINEIRAGITSLQGAPAIEGKISAFITEKTNALQSIADRLETLGGITQKMVSTIKDFITTLKERLNDPDFIAKNEQEKIEDFRIYFNKNTLGM